MAWLARLFWADWIRPPLRYLRVTDFVSYVLDGPSYSREPWALGVGVTYTSFGENGAILATNKPLTEAQWDTVIQDAQEEHLKARWRHIEAQEALLEANLELKEAIIEDSDKSDDIP